MALPDRTIDIRHRPEPPLRVALTGWYDPDSISFDAQAHEAAPTAIIQRPLNRGGRFSMKAAIPSR
jgi:hypothetical protein